VRSEESPPPGPKHPLGRMFLIGIVASVIGVVIALVIDWFPVNAANSTKDIDTLYDVLMIVSVPIFVLVMTVAIYSVVRYRARPGDMGDGAPIHGNTRLEVIWVAVPTVIVTALAIYAWIVLDDVEAAKPNELKVTVVSQQFAWRFEYPQYGKATSTQLYLPKDRPVKFDVITKDVLHSFWVPSFRLKTDAVPGLTTYIRLTPSRLGTYDVVCAELCGLGHSTMRQSAHVVEPQAFDEWVNKQKAAGGGSGGGVPPSTEPEPGSSADSGANTIPAG
jgi:cytochrome c oxidase subunit II